LGLNLHGASKTKEAFPSKQILTVKPPSPSPPVLVTYVNRKRKIPHPQKNKEIRRKQSHKTRLFNPQ